MQPTQPSQTKRPWPLKLAIGVLSLMALVSLVAPFISRGGGMLTGQRPPSGGQPPLGDNAGAPGAGQAGDVQGGPPSSGDLGQFANGQRPQLPNQAGFNLLQPVRIAEGGLGGLLCLLAALGLWKRQKWGMFLALAVAVISLLAAAVTFLSPLLGRVFWLRFLTNSTWQAIAGISGALLVAVLVLLPASRKTYVTMPRERRVM